MVSREFPAIVTGYSHSVDVVVRRGLYLQPRGGTHSFRYQVEFCSKERGNEKISSTHTNDVPRFRNCFCRYTEGRRCATCQSGAAQLEELRQALQSQQEQLQMLKEELSKRDRQIDEAREAAAAANARATEASTKATEAVNSTAEVKSTAIVLNSSVSDLKASNEVLKTTVATEQADAKKATETGPSTIKYKSINITPV